MYALPPDFTPQALLQAELVSIAYYEYDTHLSFGNDCAITLRAPFEYGSANGASVVVEPGSHAGDPRGLALVGRTVVAATAIDAGDLRLDFDDGQFLVCISEAGYESYDVRLGEQRYIM